MDKFLYVMKITNFNEPFITLNSMNNLPNQPSINFWIISILAFLWNLIGVFAYLGQSFMSEEIIKSLSQSEQNYFSNLPAWVTAAFASAVFSGLFGAIALLLRKKIAFLLYIFSLITLIIQHYYNFYIQNDIDISGMDMILPLATLFIGILLISFASKMIKIRILS